MAAGRLTKRRRLRAGSLSATKRSYPTSEVRGSGLECQAATAQEWPRGATLCLRSVAAGRIYPASEVSCGQEETPSIRGQGGGREELPRIQGEWWPGGDTLCPRSGAARRSHLMPEARGSDPEEPP